MIRHIVFFLAGLSFVIPSRAQQPSTETRAMLYYFNGGAGSYFPLSARSSLSEVGAASSFQFQFDYKDHLFGRFIFDQYNVAFHTRFSQGAANININGKVPTTLLGLDAGYQYKLKRFSPYAYIGVGLALTEIPFLESKPDNGDVILTTSSRSSLAVRAGLGVSYRINRFFILYLEPQFLTFPVRTQVYDGMLNGMSIQVGFKTPLQ